MEAIKLENIDIPNFDPSSINKGQEMIFTLKDTNVLDDDYKNNYKDNLQIDEIKYVQNTGISIERYNENELLETKNDKNNIEIKDDDGQIIDESTLLNKFDKIKNRIEKKGESLMKKKKFQEEFYNEEELKLLNKKKKRKKNTAIALFDIDINDEENKEDKKSDKGKIEKADDKNINNGNYENTKKSIYTSEEKEML